MRKREDLENWEEDKEEAPKKKSWKTDFFMGIAAIIIGLPFFAVDYKPVGIIMLVIGLFCAISGLSQKAVDEKEESVLETGKSAQKTAEGKEGTVLETGKSAQKAAERKEGSAPEKGRSAKKSTQEKKAVRTMADKAKVKQE